MMKNKKIFLITCLLTLALHTLYANICLEDGRRFPALDKEINKFIKNLEKEYDLYCEGVLSDKSNGKIEEISLDLYAFRRTSIGEARQIHITCHEKFLQIINSSEELRPYLVNYPFTNDNLKVGLSFHATPSRHFADGTVDLIFNAQGIVTYSRIDISKNTRFEDLLEEPFEEATNYVHNHPLTYDLKHHKDIGFEKEIDKLFVKLAHKIYRKYGIKCAYCGGNMVSTIDDLAFHFVSNKSTSLDIARLIHLDINEMILIEINSNTKLRCYLKEYPFRSNQIFIKLEFLKNYRTNFHDGNVSTILMKENQISYIEEQEINGINGNIYYKDVILLQESESEAKSCLEEIIK